MHLSVKKSQEGKKLGDNNGLGLSVYYWYGPAYPTKAEI